MSVVEELSNIDVDDMLQLRKKKQCLLLFLLLFVFASFCIYVRSGLAIVICCRQ